MRMKKYLVFMFLVIASCGTPLQLSSEDGPNYYSATSKDGIFFVMDKRSSLSSAATDQIHLESGLVRKYEIQNGNISSSISYDGIVWQKESGERLELPKGISASDLSVEEESDGTFKIFFKGE